MSYLVSQIVKDWSQLLAVSAPRSVELDQNILFHVGDDVIKVLAHGNNNGAAVVVGDGLGLHVRLEFVGLDVVQELLQHFHSKTQIRHITPNSKFTNS